MNVYNINLFYLPHARTLLLFVLETDPAEVRTNANAACTLPCGSVCVSHSNVAIQLYQLDSFLMKVNASNAL